MGVTAIISREPPLELSEWLNCIDQNDALVRTEPRPMINPFTGKPTILHYPPGDVLIRIGGATVGAVEPSPDFEGDGELLVYAPVVSKVRSVVEGIARFLGADLRWVADAP
jgi:hypothetical protein